MGTTPISDLAEWCNEMGGDMTSVRDENGSCILEGGMVGGDGGHGTQSPGAVAVTGIFHEYSFEGEGDVITISPGEGVFDGDRHTGEDFTFMEDGRIMVDGEEVFDIDEATGNNRGNDMSDVADNMEWATTVDCQPDEAKFDTRTKCTISNDETVRGKRWGHYYTDTVMVNGDEVSDPSGLEMDDVDGAYYTVDEGEGVLHIYS